MPIYEYRCEACGHRSEELQRLADPPLTTCPKCGGVYKKLLSAPAFQFKGSGWYVTDYARSGAKGGEGKSEGNAEGKAEAKAEAASTSSSEGSSSAKSESTAPKSEKAAS